MIGLKKKNFHMIFIHAFFVLMSLSMVVPFLLIIAVSLSRESDLYEFGYRLIPKNIDLTAYRVILENPSQILNGYKMTISFTVLGTFLSVLVMALFAYAISREDYKYRKGLTFFVFFTMLFGGGLVPTYILNTQYLGLGNSFWIYILPSLANPFYIIILRTFFKGLPASIFESARMDGASEFRIFSSIVLPLSKPVLATIALFGVLMRWNDWFTSMIYIDDPKKFSLQFILQKLLLELQFLQQNYNDLPPGMAIEEIAGMPTETIRMAICVLVAGPILVVFPFFQKYFSKGLTVGSIKE